MGHIKKKQTLFETLMHLEFDPQTLLMHSLLTALPDVFYRRLESNREGVEEIVRSYFYTQPLGSETIVQGKNEVSKNSNHATVQQESLHLTGEDTSVDARSRQSVGHCLRFLQRI